MLSGRALCCLLLLCLAHVASSQYIPCAAGWYNICPIPFNCCFRCAAGKFSAAVGALTVDTCSNCAAGKFSAAQNATACTDCPADMTSPIGSTMCSAGSSAWTSLLSCNKTSVSNVKNLGAYNVTVPIIAYADS